MTALLTLIAYNFGSNLKERPGGGIIDAVLRPNSKLIDGLRTGELPDIIKNQLGGGDSRDRRRKKLRVKKKARGKKQGQKTRT